MSFFCKKKKKDVQQLSDAGLNVRSRLMVQHMRQKSVMVVVPNTHIHIRNTHTDTHPHS